MIKAAESAHPRCALKIREPSGMRPALFEQCGCGPCLILRPSRRRDRITEASRAGGGPRQVWRCGTEGPPSVASDDRDRAVALSLQLAQAHQELRRRINQLRADPRQGHPGNNMFASYCLAFCAALTFHHQGEDAGMFVELLRQRPELAKVVSNLVEDHEMITAIVSRVAELAGEAARSHGPTLEKIGRELDGLTAIMESHFNYEERAISKALDGGMPDAGWSDMVFNFNEAVH